MLLPNRHGSSDKYRYGIKSADKINVGQKIKIVKVGGIDEVNTK